MLPKRPLYVLSNKLRRPRLPIERMKEKWTADFSKPERSCFIIKPEISYNANLEKLPSRKGGALFLGLKKKNCMAWLETEHRVYVDQIINARFRFDSHGSYCAAGIMFRAAGQGTGSAGGAYAASGTFYLAMVSSKGYFRLDAVNGNIPRPLIGWTGIPDFNANEAYLSMIALSDHFIFFYNGKWIAEAHDNSIPGGHLGFALISYDSDFDQTGMQYACRAWLDFLSVDARTGAVAAEYQKWENNAEISAESRFRLAESLAALDCFDAAYNQILKTWEQREELARSVTATYTEMRTKSELLFAARMLSRLGRYAAAEEYIDTCLALGADGAEELDILAEKTQILSAQNKYEELAALLPDYIKLLEAEKVHAELASLYALLGHACWNLQDYNAAAAAWDTALSLDKYNGLYAARAADAFEMLGNKKKALQRRMAAEAANVSTSSVTAGKSKTKPAAARKTTIKKPVKKVEKKPAAKAKPVTVKKTAVKKTITKAKSKTNKNKTPSR